MDVLLRALFRLLPIDRLMFLGPIVSSKVVDAEFGQLLLRRRLAPVLVLVLAMIAMFACIGFSAAYQAWHDAMTTADPHVRARFLEQARIMGFCGACLSVIALGVAWMAPAGVRLFEHGVDARKFWVVRTRFPYSELDALTVTRSRRRDELGDVSVVSQFKLMSRNGRRVRCGVGGVWRKGLSGEIGEFPRLPLEDAIDAVVRCTAGAIAARWSLRLESGESVQWTSYATLTPQGVAAWDGPGKGCIATYEEMGDATIEGEVAIVRLRSGEEFVSIPTTEANLYPGLMVLRERLRSQSALIEV